MNLDQVAVEIARRLANSFLLDYKGRQAVFGPYELFNTDLHWRDLTPLYEYFHGDTGRGCGASYQIGWSSMIASIIIRLGDRLDASEATKADQ